MIKAWKLGSGGSIWAVLVLGLASCSFNADTGGDAGISMTVPASGGGSLSMGGATIDIPAGALSKDTAITLERKDSQHYPQCGLIASYVFEIGPTGLKFKKPATIDITFDAKLIPGGKSPVLAFLRGEAWVPLEGSKVAGDRVSAPTTHLTPFAVFAVDALPASDAGGPDSGAD